MLRQLLLLCLLLSTIQAQAEDFPDVQYVRAYDADTITVNLKDLPPVFGEELGIRVAGIDAPEIRGDDSLRLLKSIWPLFLGTRKKPAVSGVA